MPKKSWNMAIVGATGAVGQELIKILEERSFPVGSLKLLASENSLGKTIPFHDRDFPVDALNENSFNGVEIAFFSAGSEISKKFAPIAAKAGATVIDNTAFFRMDADVPLIVPEVNPEKIAEGKKRGIIANPNCSTIQLVVVLKALMQKAKIKRVVVSTYQSVSGAGLEAMAELSSQTVALFSQKEIEAHAFPHRIAFNCIPHIDLFLEDGYTKEERKLMDETSKILGTKVPLTATTVRVPVFYGHSESVNIEFESKITAREAHDLLKKAPGVEVMDLPLENIYPLATSAAGKDPVYVGRIREDVTVPFGLNCWIVADNIRKGAALNAVQIAELCVSSS
ncbi:MAG: aspartate-semialdehyde dehydrogenase [Deltaproteobacteria bacterium]|nr:aspartate-semialdehyde dehydrogenase [Deltaproteobacteria bacterium]